MSALVSALVVAILCSQAFIDLELSANLGSWHINVPLADSLALALLPLALWGLRTRRIPLPGPAGYALFLVASAISVSLAIDPHAALHHLVRKPVFLYLAYGVGLASAVARTVPLPVVVGAVIAYGLCTAGLSVGTSILRFASGDGLWYSQIAGITPNHKTLAVGLAPWIPILMSSPWTATPRLRMASRAALAIVLVAIGASTSKTAWITAAFGLAWSWPPTARLVRQPKIAIPALAASLAAALYAPLLVGSAVMLDAARSRHSLDLRAWKMFSHNPLFGSGTGMNVVEQMVTFPHYRVNGVDAHGVIQKIASETGAVGLAGYLLFVGSMGLVLRAAARREGDGLSSALWATFLALHLNLLLSTETFSPTHWVPLAVCWGLAQRNQP